MKKSQFFIILILTIVVVLAWIVFSVIHNYQTSTISNITMQQIIPIAPNFDTKTIQNLGKRNFVSPSFNLDQISASQAGILPTPTPTPTPILTPLPTIIINQNLSSLSATSTNGGTLK